MVKKILGIVAGCAIVLVVLLFFLLILIQYQDFFGQAITWLLCGCVGILMLFVVYIMASWIVDAVRKNKQDEDRLGERSLERLLSGKGVEVASDLALDDLPEPEADARRKKRAAIQEKASRKRAEYKAKKAAEEKARQRKQEKKRTEKQAEDTFPVEPSEPALEPELAAPEAERQASAAQPEVPREGGEADSRKSQAVASARKQAEAAATARRRAAQTAARTQAFAAVNIEAQPVFDTVQLAAPEIAQESANQNIWEKMQVRQSAAPQLSSKEYIPTAQYGVKADGTLSALQVSTGMAHQQVGTLPAPDGAGQETHPGQATGRVALTGGVHATGNVFRTHTIPVLNPDGSIRAPQHTQPIPGQQSRPVPPQRTMQMPVQGRPVPRPGQQPIQGRPQQTVQIPAQGQLRPGQPVPGRPAQGHSAPRAGQPVQGQPASPTFGRTGVVPVQHTAVGSAPAPDGLVTGSTASFAVQAAGRISSAQPLASTEPTAAQPSAAPKAQKSNVEEPPKRPRGRPPKPKDPEEEAKPKRPRGRPPKPKDPEEENKPKRPRGRPPKPKDPEEENKPKRPRGRPRKNPLPEEQEVDAGTNKAES